MTIQELQQVIANLEKRVMELEQLLSNLPVRLAQ